MVSILMTTILAGSGHCLPVKLTTVRSFQNIRHYCIWKGLHIIKKLNMRVCWELLVFFSLFIPDRWEASRQGLREAIQGGEEHQQVCGKIISWSRCQQINWDLVALKVNQQTSPCFSLRSGHSFLPFFVFSLFDLFQFEDKVEFYCPYAAADTHPPYPR